MTALRTLRLARRLSQRELGQRAGVLKDYVSAWEHGRQPLAWGRLSRIADVLNVTTDAVLGRGEPPAATVDALAARDRQLLDAMKHHAEQLLGPQVLRLAGGWHHVAEMAWLGDLFRIRNNFPVCADARPEEPQPPAPPEWYTGWQSQRQIAKAGG